MAHDPNAPTLCDPRATHRRPRPVVHNDPTTWYVPRTTRRPDPTPGPFAMLCAALAPVALVALSLAELLSLVRPAPSPVHYPPALVAPADPDHADDGADPDPTANWPVL